MIQNGYKEDLYLKYDKEKKKFGYVNIKDEYIIIPQYKKAQSFEDCMALVCVKKWWKLKNRKMWHYINKNNEVVVPPRESDR